MIVCLPIGNELLCPKLQRNLVEIFSTMTWHRHRLVGKRRKKAWFFRVGADEFILAIEIEERCSSGPLGLNGGVW